MMTEKARGPSKKMKDKCYTSSSSHTARFRAAALSLPRKTLTDSPKMTPEQKVPLQPHKLDINIQHLHVKRQTSKVSN